MVILGRIGERADLRPAVEPLPHAREACRDRDLVVGQARRGERVAIEPRVAERDALVVIALEVAVVAGIVADELTDRRCAVIEKGPHGSAVELAALAADQDPAGTNPRKYWPGLKS